MDAGIQTFVDLTTPADKLTPYAHHLEQVAYRLPGFEANHLSFPIPDLGVPSDRGQMQRILRAIDDEIAQGRGVYVHCWGGVGRTGTVVGCWLAERHGSGQIALEKLAGLWQGMAKVARKPESPETAEQREYVLGWV